MIKRFGQAEWKGGLKEGTGSYELESKSCKGSYQFGTRFGDESGSNPEELIAAAHASCFSMALAAALESEGYRPTVIRTTAHVHIEKKNDGFHIPKIELETVGEVTGIDAEQFITYATTAKETCPVSRLLQAAEITLTSKLIA